MKRILRDNDFKATPQRLAVLHVLHSGSGSIDIESIHNNVKEILPKTGLATIYRTLQCLSEIGLVTITHQRDGRYFYSVSTEGQGHFLICTECSRTVDLQTCHLDKNLGFIERQTGFRVTSHFLQIYGKCGDCHDNTNDPDV